jgi:hypothetical protein
VVPLAVRLDFRRLQPRQPVRKRRGPGPHRRKAALLPVYIRRYAATGSLSLSLATLIGDTAPLSLQLIAISPLLVCVPLLVISLSIWIALLTPPV